MAHDQDFYALLELDTLALTNLHRSEKIKQWVEEKTCYLIECNKIISAYGVLNYSFFEFGFIPMLTVRENFRQKHHGISLITYFQEICATPKLFTSTNQSNIPMQQLLIKAGFNNSGYIENLDEDDPELIFIYQKC